MVTYKGGFSRGKIPLRIRELWKNLFVVWVPTFNDAKWTSKLTFPQYLLYFNSCSTSMREKDAACFAMTVKIKEKKGK